MLDQRVSQGPASLYLCFKKVLSFVFRNIYGFILVYSFRFLNFFLGKVWREIVYSIVESIETVLHWTNCFLAIQNCSFWHYLLITVCKNKMSKPFLRGQFFKLILLQVWISDKRIQKRININEFIPSVWIRNSEIRETRLNAAPLVLSFSALSNQCLEETNKLSSLTSFYQVKANLWANEFWNRLVFSLIYIEVFRKTLSIQTNHVEKILIW